MADCRRTSCSCRSIFLFRLLKVDTVVCYDPWAHDEENPDHVRLAPRRRGRVLDGGPAHDYPEQFAAGLTTHAVREKYYYARRPEITRVVDISGVHRQKVEANRAMWPKGRAAHHGAKLRADLAKRN